MRRIKVTKKDGSYFWNCSQCNAEHELNAYVAAHADELLRHECKCGAVHETIHMEVYAIDKARKKK